MNAIIGPSILNCDIIDLYGEPVKIIGADITHVDVMDDHFVLGLSRGLPATEVVIKSGTLSVDMHLMIEDLDRWTPQYAEVDCESVTFHVEATAAPLRLARELHCIGAHIGLAPKSVTDIAPFVDTLNELDTILIMTVEPNFDSQSLIEQMIPKIRRTRTAINTAGLQVSIQTSGGVSRAIIKRATAADTDNFVVGSAVSHADNAHCEMETLRELANACSHRSYRLSDNRNEIPFRPPIFFHSGYASHGVSVGSIMTHEHSGVGESPNRR